MTPLLQSSSEALDVEDLCGVKFLSRSAFVCEGLWVFTHGRGQRKDEGSLTDAGRINQGWAGG